jgi:Zinc finger C-x8-C-x5-C-x3-H type (and similar)
MHHVVTTSATATNDLFYSSSEDLLSPISLTTRAQSGNALGWSQPHESVNVSGEGAQEVCLACGAFALYLLFCLRSQTWQSSASKESISNHTSNNRRAQSKSYQKVVFPSQMPSRTASSESESSPLEPSSNHSTGTPVNSGRWRFNGTGQFVDSEAASTEWDLADEIVRLNIGGVGADAQMKTPPKSKMPNTAVVQLNETSPLETSSDVSADSSPHPSDHQINVAHSRGSSTDTTDSTHDSVLSSASQTMQAPSQLKVSPNNEAKERPHSFSGGLSAAELRRLQQAGDANGLQDAANQHQQWSSAHFRDTIGPNDKQFPPEQPTYPSLTNTTVFPRSQQQQFDPRSAQSSAAAASGNGPHPEDLMADYHLQQRNFNQLSQQALAAAGGGPPVFAAGRPNTNLQYRQPQRGFTPQGMPPSATPLGYPGGHHTPHLSLGNTQQMYDMMNAAMHPDNPHPAVTRVQQQHNVFRPNHQHSASDPSAMRDAATLALLNGNMQAYAPPGPAMYPPGMAPPAMSLYNSQYYGAQEAYPRAADLAAAQAIANRLQPQYTGYGTVDEGSNGNGPSANNRKLGLYKTELCRSWEEKGTCRYGAKCQFAHGEDELRKVARHPKYKTEICRVSSRPVYPWHNNLMNLIDLLGIGFMSLRQEVLLHSHGASCVRCSAWCRWCASTTDA